jgi:hypothetical protein
MFGKKVKQDISVVLANRSFEILKKLVHQVYHKVFVEFAYLEKIPVSKT